jgi:transcriptional regulator with XRE-family HTH domain
MPTPVIQKTDLTLPPIAFLLEHPMAKQDTETLGARIARLRKEKGLTQAELADALKVSQPVISDYENDVIRLPTDALVQVSELLGVTTDELLGIKTLTPRASVGNSIKNRRLYRRMQEIEKLPRRDQEALLRTIEAFISKTG